MYNVSMVRRSLESIRKDFEAFDLMLERGVFCFAREVFARVNHRRSPWSIASYAGLATTAVLVSVVLLTSSAL